MTKSTVMRVASANKLWSYGGDVHYKHADEGASIEARRKIW